MKERISDTAKPESALLSNGIPLDPPYYEFQILSSTALQFGRIPANPRLLHAFSHSCFMSSMHPWSGVCPANFSINYSGIFACCHNRRIQSELLVLRFLKQFAASRLLDCPVLPAALPCRTTPSTRRAWSGQSRLQSRKRITT